MLPDFPNIKKYIEEEFNYRIKGKINEDPFLSRIRKKRIHEGNRMTSSSMEGHTESSEFKSIASEFTEISRDEIIEKGVNAFDSRIDTMSEEFMNQLSQSFFKKMHEVTETTGNIINANGRSISPEVILEALEKVTIDFDEFGNPLLPALILHPEALEKIKDKIPKWETDPNLQRKHRELIERKRREWDDRESRRKLVD